MAEEIHKATIKIADKSFIFHVTPEKESVYRRAAKRINDKIAFYQAKFSGRDTQDILSAVLLETMLSLISLEQKDAIGDDLRMLEQLNRRLDEYININA